MRLRATRPTDRPDRPEKAPLGARFVAFLAVLSLTAGPSTLARAAYLPAVSGQSTGMVVTSQAIATQVGRRILQGGGNAVDAAVAVGYALAVVHPCCGNIGGGGFMTIHLAEENRQVFLDFRERAPKAATADMFLDENGKVDRKKSLDSYLAVGVPGTVLGLETARERYGTLSRSQLMAPAVALAEEGYVLSEGDAAILAFGAAAFAREENVARTFLDDGKPLQAGYELKQPELGRTLRLIRSKGADAFYEGPIAEKIVAASEAGGGLLTLEDFRDYEVKEREPVRCEYRGYQVVSAPPPSSGGTAICLILNMLEDIPLGEMGFHSAASIHHLVEVMRRAYVDRNTKLGDPDFVENPLGELLSLEYARRRRAEIDPERATPIAASSVSAALHEGTDTTHASIVDEQGNAVALTYTINGYFGNKRIAGDTGFFLNNEMDDFTAKPGEPNLFGLVQGARNAVAPGKRPLSSMSPTVILKDGRVFMVLGSPGGGRIITITLSGILNVIDHGMDLSSAVNAPRIHHQWLPDKVFHEPHAFTKDTAKLLGEMGHTLQEQRPWGALEAILVTPTDDGGGKKAASGGDDSTHGDTRSADKVYGANDNRRPAGSAMAAPRTWP